MPDAFAQVALGVFALLADPATVDERDAREVRAHGSTPELLLVNWLNECLYVRDLEAFVPRRVEFTTFSLEPSAPGGEPLRLHCRLHGEDFDPLRHIPRAMVPGISEDGAAVLLFGGRSEACVFIQEEGGAGASPK